MTPCFSVIGCDMWVPRWCNSAVNLEAVISSKIFVPSTKLQSHCTRLPVVPNTYTFSQLSASLQRVKWSCYRPGVAQRVGRGIALLFHDRGTRRGWVVSSTPQLLFTPGKDQIPLYRRLGGPQGRSGRAENVVPTGIWSRTIQPVTQSLYRLSYPAHLR